VKRKRIAKPPAPDLGVLIRHVYDDLVEIEALAVASDECVTMLPPSPSGKHRQTMARLFTLVGKTASRAYDALERGEELVALREAQLVAKIPKRAPARRAS
jgi:hypothetical protein